MVQDTEKPQTSDKVQDIASAKSADTTTADRKTQRDQQVLEINRQMSSLEGAIDKLNKKVNSTNRKIKSEVDRLTTSDAEITDKVADTYKQMGVIDTALVSLNTDSSKIGADLKKVNSKVKAFEKKSAKALDSVVEQQAVINDEFKAQYASIVERAEKLSKKATSITTKLNKSIKSHRKELSELEARIVSELETIAEASQQRDSNLGKQIDDATSEISSQKAKMMIMQRVDEALEKRAASLEANAERLLDETEELRKTTDALDVLTSKLSSDVEVLEQKTALLAEQNEQQQGDIDTLHDKSEHQAQSLLALGRKVGRHFGLLGAISLLLLLAIIGLYLFDQYQRDVDMAAQTERDGATVEQVAKLQTQVGNGQVASRQAEQQIGDLQQSIEGIKQDMQGMTDQVESLDGRLQYMSPLYSFGSDNTIRGEHGLAALNPEHFSIRLATVDQKQEMYQVAQRYSGYLKDHDLAYYNDADGRYVLIYGSEFESEEAVVAALRTLPRYINFEKIGTLSNREILGSLK